MVPADPPHPWGRARRSPDPTMGPRTVCTRRTSRRGRRCRAGRSPSVESALGSCLTVHPCGGGWMGRPYSDDFRERVLAEAERMSARAAGARFGIRAATATRWTALARAGQHTARPWGGRRSSLRTRGTRRILRSARLLQAEQARCGPGFRARGRAWWPLETLSRDRRTAVAVTCGRSAWPIFSTGLRDGSRTGANRREPPLYPRGADRSDLMRPASPA